VPARESTKALRLIRLAQQPVAAGEAVVDVPATLASRVRVLWTGRPNRNDPNDALSIAIAALRSRGLRPVEPLDPEEALPALLKVDPESEPEREPGKRSTGNSGK
jgi:hypothetical protein